MSDSSITIIGDKKFRWMEIYKRGNMVILEIKTAPNVTPNIVLVGDQIQELVDILQGKSTT